MPEALPPVVLGSLSPSRAADFKTCPLLYRFRCIDRLPEAPSRAAARGTLVHAVLESLFDLPAAAAHRRRRPRPAAGGLGTGCASRARTSTTLFADDTDGAEFAEWMSSAGRLLGNYFTLEDPSRLEPAAREQLVEVVADGVAAARLSSTASTSRPPATCASSTTRPAPRPREAFEGKALFQMKFYALVLWRTRGVVPRQLRLMYLADGDTLSYAPDAEELQRFERTLMAIWAAIQRATMQTGDFRPSPGRLCDWCDFKALLPGLRRHAAALPRASGAHRPARRPAARSLTARSGAGSAANASNGIAVSAGVSRAVEADQPADLDRLVDGVDHDVVAGADDDDVAEPGRCASGTGPNSPAATASSRRSTRARPPSTPRHAAATSASRTGDGVHVAHPRLAGHDAHARRAAGVGAEVDAPVARDVEPAVVGGDQQRRVRAAGPRRGGSASGRPRRAASCHCGDAMPCTWAAVSSSLA